MAMVLRVVVFYTMVIKSALVPVVLLSMALMVNAVEFVAVALKIVVSELWGCSPHLYFNVSVLSCCVFYFPSSYQPPRYR